MIIFSEGVLYAISMLINGSLLFLLIYHILIISDLECDYLNAQEACSKMNVWVYPKLIAQAYLTAVLLINGSWFLALVNLPVAAWFGYEVSKVPKGNLGLYDPVDIHNRGELKRHMRDSMIFLGFYLVLFFLYLYCMLIALLRDDPLQPHAHNVADEMKFETDF